MACRTAFRSIKDKSIKFKEGALQAVQDVSIKDKLSLPATTECLYVVFGMRIECSV